MEMKTQQGGPVRDMKSRGKNYNPYIEEQAMSGSKNTRRRGSQQQNGQEWKGGANTSRSIYLEVLKQGTQQLETGPGCEETQKESIRTGPVCSSKWGGASSGKENETISPGGTTVMVIRPQTNKLAGYVGSTETTRNHIGIQGRKYRSCKQRYKEAEKKNRNSNTLMGQKIFYWKVVLQEMLEIMIRSYLAGLTGVLQRIPYVRRDHSRQSWGRWRLKEGFRETDLAGSRHLRSVSRGGRINLYSNEKIFDVLITYEAANCNVHAARQLYQGCYWNSGVPYHSTFASVNR
ncbi:hypothetical protein TNCV_3485001 [Trichonephila clavipes]|nr:hypothetical protein TNCV_3485001 [Trichonephila clavipes]